MQSGPEKERPPRTNANTVFDLSPFERQASLQAFFESVPTDWAYFNVLNLPAELWPNLYLADLEDPRKITVRLVGDNIRSWFGRNLRGLDLRHTTHGEHSRLIIGAYEDAVESGRRFAIRQRVYLATPGFVVRLECGVAPLSKDGRVYRLLGYLFLGQFLSRSPTENEFMIIR